MRNPAPWQRRYENIALLSLLFGIVSQYLFVGNGFNLSVPLFVLAFYGLFFYAVKGRIGGFEQWRGQSRSGWLLGFPVVLLSLTFAIYANALFRGLNVAILPALVAAQTVLLTRSSAKPWFRTGFYADVLYLSLIKPFAYLGVPFGLLADRFMPNGEGDNRSAPSKLRRILFGLLLAAPLLGLVIGLLASADRIFNELVWRIPRLLFHWNLFDGFIRIFLCALFACYAFCYLWAILFNRSGDHREEAAAGEWNGLSVSAYSAKRTPFAFDSLTACTLLISFNLVYLLFAAIQFSYLFGASRGLLPSGVVYAEYARQGFAQLIVVALINLILLLCGLHLVKRGERTGERVRKLSLSLLVGCTVIMLISAFTRLSLYEEMYGYTQTRLLVHGFMIFLCFILAASLFRIWNAHFSLAKTYIGLAIAAYLVMNYANLDAMIAERNCARYESSGRIDEAYLMTLSADALPALLKLEAKHKNGVDGLDIVIASIREQSASEHGWPGWNWSKSRAERASGLAEE
ncbi:DUF4153 domain-containing protein [Paenibacillus sacheonensis]|uniref:DUF4173 domain-containing protein n=1 Tax=Paenibacillus sacheonensis TaxID=742054 RepID=A0A7X5BXC9_9BACL|nr:DUF4173 domain-containing protein [Paenibacillus sacheonensis]MBM7563186.1 hypothetical protein [Paenibacillus sacheonensis]NBC68251.1 DUF4173 domain-containing protein [Paenibacillus sacheonensis]